MWNLGTDTDSESKREPTDIRKEILERKKL